MAPKPPLFTALLTLFLTAACSPAPPASQSRALTSTCPANQVSLSVLASPPQCTSSSAPPSPPSARAGFEVYSTAAGRFISESPLTVLVSHRAVGLTETARDLAPPPPHSVAPTDDDAVPRPPSPPTVRPTWFYPSITLAVKFGMGLATVALLLVLIYAYCPWVCQCLACFNGVMGWITNTLWGRRGSPRQSIVGRVPLPVLTAAAGGVGIATIMSLHEPPPQTAAGVGSAALRFGFSIGHVGLKYVKKLTKRQVVTSTTSIAGRDGKLLLAGAFLGAATMALYMKGPAIYSYIKEGGQKAIHWVKTRAGPGQVEASEAGHKQTDPEVAEEESQLRRSDEAL